MQKTLSADRWSLLAWAIVIAGGAMFCWRSISMGGYFAEDAYITFRFATHLAEGHGLVWNVGGDPVEGYTSPLHVGLLALAIRLGATVETAALVISVGSIVGLTAVFIACVRREAGRLAPLAAFVLGVYLLDSRLAIHNTAGLDTTLYMFLLAANLLLAFRLVEHPTGGAALALAGIDLLCLLGRPDAAPYLAMQVAILLAASVWRVVRGRDHSLLVWVGVSQLVLVLAGLSYLAAKHAYFGYLLPNPFYLKSNQASELYGLMSVARYLRDTTLAMLPLAPALLFVDYRRLAVWWARPGSPSKTALLLLPPLAFLGYYTTVVPEVNFLNRFEYPTYFFFALAAAYVIALGEPLERITGWMADRMPARVPAVLAAAALAAGLAFQYRATAIDFPWFRIVESQYYRPIGDALAASGLGSRATVVFDSAGVVPYVSRFSHIDPVGLTDNVLSGRNPISVWERETYIWGREPDVYIGPEPPASPGATGCVDDPSIETRFVQRVLLAPDRYGEGKAYFRTYGHLGSRERCDLVHFRMRELRDRWDYKGEVPFPVPAPPEYTTFIYVRRSSPYGAELSRALEGFFARGPGIARPPQLGAPVSGAESGARSK